MKTPVVDALLDSLEMVPVLLLIYVVVGAFERKFGDTINTRLQSTAKAGPALGAIFGCIPQCGFSVLASAMYARRLLTIGTLLAVYLSTSDEAIPVILSQPQRAKIVLPIILAKLCIGIVCGYAVDFLLGSYKKSKQRVEQKEAHGIDQSGCCDHDISGKSTKWEFLLHPLVHTAKVFVFVFITSLGINYLIYSVGTANLGRVLLQHSIFQPVVAAFVGLIPNCAASVAITEIFLKGGISFGSAIAGLCASAGLGILVLLKENGDTRDTIRVLSLLVGISAGLGIVIQIVKG